MNKASKQDVKTAVDRILDKAGVVRHEMASELDWSESYLSRHLSPNDNYPGFVCGYLWPMGFLSVKYPKAFNGIDSTVQRYFNQWRTPQNLSEVRSDADNALRLNHTSSVAVNVLIDGRKSDRDKRLKLAELAALVAEIQRSYDEKETFRLEEVVS